MYENRRNSSENRGFDSIRTKSFKSVISDNTNDNIIYEKDEYLVTTGKENEEAISYCGISSDSVLGCVLNVITSTLGGGCLAFPYILHQLGFYISFVIFILVTVSIYFSNDLLRSFVVDTKYFSFALMTNEILGKRWLKVYAISSFIYYSVIEINYLTLMHNTFRGIIIDNNTYNTTDNTTYNTTYNTTDNTTDNTTANKIFSPIYLVITMIIEILICSFIFNPKKIHILSLVTIVCFIIIVLATIIVAFKNLITKKTLDYLSYQKFFFAQGLSTSEIILHIFSFIIEYLYGYSYNSSLPTLLGNMKNIDEDNSKKIHIYSFTGIFFSYIAISFFGYLICEENDQQTGKNNEKYLFATMKKFASRHEFIYYFCKILLWLYLFTVIPMRFIVVRDNYTSLVKDKMTPKKDLFVTITCIFIYNLVVYFTLDNTGDNSLTTLFIELFGGIFGVIICFCLPVINYVAVNGKKKLKSIIGYILIGFYGIVGLISAVYSFFKSSAGK